jgi:DNA-directed RNA polymerase subunit RPC12/RpoP
MTKCVVCGSKIPLRICDVYQVAEPRTVVGAITQPEKVFDAIDCPHCGCQMLLKVRMPKVEIVEVCQDDD